jgi:hypothetical protein
MFWNMVGTQIFQDSTTYLDKTLYMSRLIISSCNIQFYFLILKITKFWLCLVEWTNTTRIDQYMLREIENLIISITSFSRLHQRNLSFHNLVSM